MNCSYNIIARTISLPDKSKMYKTPETEAIRTQIQPSKPKREITNVTNSQNTERSYCQPSEQLYPKRWPLSKRNRTKNDMKILEVKCHKILTSKTGNREPQQKKKL